jgi:hypothetical protein
MVEKTMKKTDSSTCQWVRARLPLWVGELGDDCQHDGEPGQLSTAERLRIDGHLTFCSNCQQYRTALEQTMGVLASAAAALPTDPEAPSIWPVLERRIQARVVRTPTRWLRIGQALYRQFAQAWVLFRSEAPLRSAWRRDSIWGTIGHWSSRFESSLRLRVAFGSGLAVAFLVTMFVVPAVQREWVDAQSTIKANAAPLPAPVLAESRLAEDPTEDVEIPNESDAPADQLVQAEPVRSPEPPASGTNSPPPQKPRLGYDVEHGIPMAPDPRDSKPVY